MRRLNKKQEKEIKKQEYCRHKNLKKVKVKDTKHINGYYYNSKCLDCGCLFLNFRVQIAYIMDIMAKENPLDNIEHPVTFVNLCKKNKYLYPVPSLAQAGYLVRNKEKFL